MVEQQAKQVARQLKIKTGTLKRNFKDYGSYKKEKETLEAKVETLKATEGTEEGVISRAESEVAETAAVLSGCWGRIDAALQDLKAHMDEVDAESELRES